MKKYIRSETGQFTSGMVFVSFCDGPMTRAESYTNLFRRPEGMSDEDWIELAEYLTLLLNSAKGY